MQESSENTGTNQQLADKKTVGFEKAFELHDLARESLISPHNRISSLHQSKGARQWVGYPLFVIIFGAVALALAGMELIQNAPTPLLTPTDGTTVYMAQKFDVFDIAILEQEARTMSATRAEFVLDSIDAAIRKHSERIAEEQVHIMELHGLAATIKGFQPDRIHVSNTEREER
jgi:hypothetical protein